VSELARATAVDASPTLVIQQLHAAYAKQPVLQGIDLVVARGEWCALLGPNASGKTTLLHCIAGMIAPTAGVVSIAGCSLGEDPRQARRQLGFACAPERLPGLLTGRQCLEVYAAAKGLKSIDAEVLHLAEELRYTPMLDLFVDTCSLGTRQKLAVLCALLGEPALVLLDEAFNGLDPASALTLKRHLRARVATGRCSVLLATHDLDIVEHHADRAALLLHGRIAGEWSKQKLSVLLSASREGFEAALAAAAQEEP
jgi:ABC-2 type transport system ATP-binding protein